MYIEKQWSVAFLRAICSILFCSPVRWKISVWVKLYCVCAIFSAKEIANSKNNNQPLPTMNYYRSKHYIMHAMPALFFILSSS